MVLIILTISAYARSPDVHPDNCIDIQDLTIIGLNNGSSVPIEADVNEDGIIDGDDYSIVESLWRSATNPTGSCNGFACSEQELCNGIDDDCDGLIDDNISLPLNNNQEGVCRGSLQSCVNGNLLEGYNTIPNYQVFESSCDSLDNDCDGTADEGCGSSGYLTVAAISEHYVLGDRVELTDPPQNVNIDTYNTITGRTINEAAAEAEYTSSKNAGIEELQSQITRNTQFELTGRTSVPPYSGYIVQFLQPSLLEKMQELKLKGLSQEEIHKELVAHKAVLDTEHEEIKNKITATLFLPPVSKGKANQISFIGSSLLTIIVFALIIIIFAVLYKGDGKGPKIGAYMFLASTAFLVLLNTISPNANITGFATRSVDNPSNNLELSNEFKIAFNGIALSITDAQASKLSSISGIKMVYPNLFVNASLMDSVPLISADKVWQLDRSGNNCSSGGECITGRGIKIGIIDTGVDYSHSDLGNCSPYIIDGRVENYFLESGHPYQDNFNFTWVISMPGYERIAVHFYNFSVPYIGDDVHILDGNDNVIDYPRGTKRDLWTASANGSIIKINIVTDSYGSGYGFIIDKVLGGTATFSLGQCTKVIDGYDWVGRDNDPMDMNGHGTHVAATAAGNGTLKGVAPDANIVAYRVLNSGGSGTFDWIIGGIERSADPNQDGNFSDHLDIISLSLGANCGGYYDYYCGPDDPLSQAIDNVASVGVVPVIAAGNSGPGDSTIGTPGTARKAITVGATNKTDNIARFSSRGVVENGDYALIKPDVVAPGVDICAAQAYYDRIWRDYRLFLQRDIHCFDDHHIAISGTSMATPHVSGVVALMKQAHPEWTLEEIKSSLKSTAIDLELPPATQGYGRVNSLEAVGVNNALSTTRPPVADILQVMVNHNYRQVVLYGITGGELFVNYRLSYGAGINPTQWNTILESSSRASYSYLGTWNFGNLSPGTYTIQLNVTASNGISSIDKIVIFIDDPSFNEIFDYTRITYYGSVPVPTVEDLRLYHRSVAVEDINNDGIKEIVAVYNKGLDNGLVYAFDSSGRVLQGFPVTIHYYIWNPSSPTIADINNDGKKDIVIASGNYIHALDFRGRSLSGFPYNVSGYYRNYCSVPNACYPENNETYRNYVETFFIPWRGAFENSIADIDGDGFSEIITIDTFPFVYFPHPPQHYDDYSGVYGNLFAVRKDGALLRNFPVNISGEYHYPASIANLDNDKNPEMIIATPRLCNVGLEYCNSGVVSGKLSVVTREGRLLPGWPYIQSYRDGNMHIYGQIATDIDNNGTNEIISATYNAYINSAIFIWNADGSRRGERIRVSHDGTQPLNPGDFNMTFIQIALGDLNADDSPEIIAIKTQDFYIWPNNSGSRFVSTSTYLHILNSSGSQLIPPVFISSSTRDLPRQPVIGDIDGDSRPEIFFEIDSWVYGVYSDGNLIQGWPKYVHEASGLVLADLENDGKLELIVHTLDGEVLIYRFNTRFNRFLLEWPMFQHDVQHTGLYTSNFIKSKIQNNGNSNLSGYLLMKVQKQNVTDWQDVEIIVRDTIPRTISSGQYLALDTIWNSTGAYIANVTGTLRIYAALLDINNQVVVTTDGRRLENTSEFIVEGWQCQNGIDDDNDYYIDLNDDGCSSRADNDERMGTQCDNGIDDDGDGRIDYPQDTGCNSKSDPNERGYDKCDNGADDDGDNLTDYPNDPGCSSPLDYDERLGTACDNNIDDDSDHLRDYQQDPGCASPYDISERSDVACDNGIDDDGDVWRDYPSDDGCSSPLDNDERLGTVCDNNVDDDQDTFTDYPRDRGCFARTDSSERGYASDKCDNGIDDDGDTFIDYPFDSGCTGLYDFNERGSNVCDNGLDDDGDGRIDYPQDDSCQSPNGQSEGSQWAQSNSTVPWAGRYSHSSIVFNNKIWVIGGYNSSGRYTNDIWSFDGTSWRREANPPWAGRYGHSSVVYNNRIWVMGGYKSTFPPLNNEVWSFDGTSWRREANPPWSARYGHSSVVFNNKILVIGGSSTGSLSTRNDVWSFDGTTWRQEIANAPWSNRHSHSSVVFNNKIWVIGGYNSSGRYTNDVWHSSNGITWTRDVAGEQVISVRDRHAISVYNNKMYITGGRLPRYPYAENDIISYDGTTWSREIENAAWSERYAHSSVVYNNKLWVIGGYGTTRSPSYKRDVWYWPP